MWDDCFSFPDLLVWLRRNRSIEVVYMDEFGRVTRKRVSGRLSELLQHEIDHLDGILAVDRARRTSDIIMRTEQKKTKRSS
jgi:peptide deformylase